MNQTPTAIPTTADQSLFAHVVFFTVAVAVSVEEAATAGKF